MTRPTANTAHDQSAIDAHYAEAERIERARTLFARVHEAGVNSRAHADREMRRRDFEALRVEMDRQRARSVLIARLWTALAMVAVIVVAALAHYS